MTDVPAVEPHTAPPPPSASAIADDAQAVVYDLAQRLAAAERDLARIPARRSALAFKSSQGDRRAQRALTGLAATETAAHREREDLGHALTEARRRLETARAAERKVQAEASIERERRLADEFIAQSARIDRALADIVQAYHRRAELRRALAPGLGEDVAKLHCETRMRCAIAASGAYEILIGKGAPARDSAVPLATADRRILSSLRGA